MVSLALLFLIDLLSLLIVNIEFSLVHFILGLSEAVWKLNVERKIKDTISWVSQCICAGNIAITARVSSLCSKELAKGPTVF